MFFNLHHPCDQIAVIEGHTTLSYGELAKLVDDFAANLPSTRQLIFLKASNTVSTLVAYLAALQCKHPIMLLSPDIQDNDWQKLISLYRPNVLVEAGNTKLVDTYTHQFSSELALILSTSGSTGSAKQVCLSANNLSSNAEAICAYLPILKSDSTITTLPFCYSYGLSVINSHLQAGACILFTSQSLFSREFWTLFKQHKVNSFAGVPHSYDMLLKLRFTQMDLPSLRYFTQAGGKLAESKIETLADYAIANDKQFFVMYGQTEASPRMAFADTQSVKNKPNSIGRAIPGGEFYLRNEHSELITQSECTGELVYRGENVMLGYATHAQELKTFTALKELCTGDIAYADQEGDYVVCGRVKRFIKLTGLRINLDEVEAKLAEKGLKAYCLGDDTKLTIAFENNNEINELKMWISQTLQIHHSTIKLCQVPLLPLTDSGKKDYPALAKQLGLS